MGHVDRTQLTEALRELEGLQFEYPEYATVAEAVRLLLDFPTEKQVEAADKAFLEWPGGYEWDYDTRRKEAIRAALEAVRDTMIGDEDSDEEG